MDETYGIAAFWSRQQVLRFEQQLRREGVQNVHVVSTPRDVAVGCGLSVRFNMQDAPAVMGALRRAQTGNLIGVYQVEKHGNARARLTALSR